MHFAKYLSEKHASNYITRATSSDVTVGGYGEQVVLVPSTFSKPLRQFLGHLV